jgi:hypothetical protein
MVKACSKAGPVNFNIQEHHLICLRTCLRATLVYTYTEMGGIEFTRMSLFYKQQVMLKVGFNDKVLGLPCKFDRTQRNIGILCAVLKVISCSL